MPQLRAPWPHSFTDRLESKRQGEVAELVFLYRATILGLKVSKPYGESERYDFIVDTGSRLLRVQIKSTRGLISKGAYRISGGRNILGGTVPYLPSQVDFIAAYIFPKTPGTFFHSRPYPDASESASTPSTTPNPTSSHNTAKPGPSCSPSLRKSSPNTPVRRVLLD